jgi:glycosyltransferase involved in cell wall biosynthesis
VKTLLPKTDSFFRICFIGRLTKEKGILLLIDSFKSVISASPAVYLTIAGDGPLRSLVEKFSSDYPENVSYLGWIEAAQLSEVYQASDAVIIPSVVPEANPIVACEAIQFEKIVIGFGKGGLKDILSAYQKGIILNDVSSQELSNEIIELSKTVTVQNRLPVS